MMTYRWEFKEPHPRVDTVMELINVPRVIAQILLNRGVGTLEDARYFLKPTLDDLHNPFLMKDMDLAVDRISAAIRSGECILVYGDYDVDGTTATTLLYLVLQSLTNQVSYYIPNRIKEGYGLSQIGIQEAANRGVTLIMAVDCGITANEEVLYAKSCGIDTIIIDHHMPGEEIPKGIAVLNPKRPDCPYPFKELCGVGLAYKVAQAIAEQEGLPDDVIYAHLDLVALGTTADIVPLRDENRILTKYGLSMMQQTRKAGLQALINTAGMKEKELATDHLVFGLAPRINAAGRMGDASRVVRLLTTDDREEAANLAAELDSENQLRRQQDAAAFEDAKKLVDADLFLQKANGLVLASAQWHPGVIGIVASRMVEAYHRPTVMIAVHGDMGRGSARTMGDFHLYNALKECADLLVQFGGHHHAAGLSIEAGNIAAFRHRFHEVVSARTTPLDFIPRLTVDTEIDLEEITPRLIKLLKMLAPFGSENHHPVLVTRNLSLAGNPNLIGIEKNHLKFKIRGGEKVFDAIAFGMAGYADGLRANPNQISLAYSVEENAWNGQTTLQLRVKDIKVGSHDG